MTKNIEPFPNLSSAGAELAMKVTRVTNTADLVVLGIVSGGVPVAVEVAKHLESPLDLITIRRLLAPRGPGSQAVAVDVAGTMVVDEEIGPRPANPQTPYDYFVVDALDGLASRAQLCRGDRSPAQLTGKAVMLVDCGIRTGLTMHAAIKAVATLKPTRITAAVPVTSDEGRRMIEAVADELIYLAAPEPFGNAGVWYRDFLRPADDCICQFLVTNSEVTAQAGAGCE